MSRNITIYQPWGGLGDNLAHSLIPRLCFERGDICQLSKHNVCRNQDIYNVVWKQNPYIRLTGSESVDMKWLDRCKLFENQGLSHVQVIQRVYGFDTCYEYPEIYYTPRYLPEYDGKHLTDFNSISVSYDGCDVWNVIGGGSDTLEVTHSLLDNKRYARPTTGNTIDINSLEFYCDVLRSCSSIVTLNSGIANLAPVIKNKYNPKLQIYVLTYKKYLKEYGSNGYFYSNVKYITVD